MTKKTNFPKRALCAVLVLVMLMGASFAYFSDYATTQVTGTAGTVAIAMDSDINLLNDEGMDILNPGDMRDGSFDITNMGNKSIDVRTTIALTALDHEGNALNFTGSETEQSEFDLYLASDVEYVEGEGYKPVAGATPLEVKSIDGNVITYVLPEYSLNGNSDEYDEVETIDGVDTFAAANDFVLVFKGAAGNEWQAASLQLDVIVEAKQHENTQAGWDIVATEQITHGSITKDVVKGENVITENEGMADEGDDATKPTKPTITFGGTFDLADADFTSGTMTFTNTADPTDEIVFTLPDNGRFMLELQPNAEYNLTIAGKKNKFVSFDYEYVVKTGSEDNKDYDIVADSKTVDGTIIVL